MTVIALQDVVTLAAELTPTEQARLMMWLLEPLKTRDLPAKERLAVFDSMTVDLGDVLPG